VAEAYVEGLMRYFAAPSSSDERARANGTRPQVPGK
jgi:hypothetical protein